MLVILVMLVITASFDLVRPDLLPLAGAIYLAALSQPALDQVHLNFVYPVVISFSPCTWLPYPDCSLSRSYDLCKPCFFSFLMLLDFPALIIRTSK